jgi:hypothetical protein
MKARLLRHVGVAVSATTVLVLGLTTLTGAQTAPGTLTLSAGQAETIIPSGCTLHTARSGVDINITCTGKATTTTKAPTTTTTAPITTTSQPTTTSAPTTTVAPTTTTTVSGGTGGNCTSPIFTTSDAEGTINIDPGPPSPEYWWVNNDAWSGSHGPQTINVCSQSSWYAVSNQPNVQGQVETYPDTEYDVAGRGNATEAISSFNGITSTFSENYPSAGSWDAAYDLWTDNWSHETMIWNQWAGSQAYWYTASGFQDVTIAGTEYHFCDIGGNGNCSGPKGTDNGDELIFAMVNQESSDSVNILAIYQWEVANGYAKSSDIPTQLQYGVEICSTSGAETFPMTGLTFSVS